MPRAPNILWIVTTQWRAQATGYAGDPNARTPCVDALAAQSVNFAQAITPHPFGPFARAALLTGIPSPENGVRDYFNPLPLGARTIAHDLRDRGYVTAFFGKWHLGKRDPHAPLVGEAHAKTIVPPEARGGFEFWEGFESGFLLNDPWLHGSGADLATPKQFSGYQSDVLRQRFAQWVGQPEKNHPTFAVVSLEAPHPPYGALAAGIVPADPSAITLPANVPRGGELEATVRRELAGYYAHIEATDRAIGGLIELVGQNGIVIFTSVHGDMHGAHGLLRKGWPHEESVRVPLLLRVPGEAPRRDDAPVSLLDLRALTLGLVDHGALGNARPAVARISMPSVVALPHQCDRVWRGVRTPTRKLALNADGSPWLFFNLENDPLEMHNLAHDPAYTREIAKLAQLA